MRQDQDAPKFGQSVSKAKQTALELYLTAKQAYNKWKANPDGVTVLDIRDLDPKKMCWPAMQPGTRPTMGD